MPKNTKGQGKIEVFRQKELIKKRLDEGYSLKPIFMEIAGELTISYRQFLRIVNKYIKEQDEQKPQTSHKPVHKAPHQHTQPNNQPATFKHSASMTDERRKLIFGE